MKFLFIALLLLSPVSAHAETGTLSERILVAGRQRMLSQRIARTACFIAYDADAKGNREKLSESNALFEASLQHLTHGGGDENFAQETDESGLRILHRTEEMWHDFKAHTDEFLMGDSQTPEMVEALSREADKILTMSNAYVRFLEISGKANGGDESMVSRLVNNSGRQRMLIQKIGKQACVLASLDSEDLSDDKIRDYVDTLREFELTAFALSFGSTVLNIPPSPTHEIEADNFGHWQSWVIMSADLAVVYTDGLSQVQMSELGFSVENFVTYLAQTVQKYAALGE